MIGKIAGSELTQKFHTFLQFLSHFRVKFMKLKKFEHRRKCRLDRSKRFGEKI